MAIASEAEMLYLKAYRLMPEPGTCRGSHPGKMVSFISSIMTFRLGMSDVANRLNDVFTSVFFASSLSVNWNTGS